MSNNVYTFEGPIPFAGTEEERVANFRTHSFDYSDEGSARCFTCDCKTWHEYANYPCGADVPRGIQTRVLR
jgi:hypothetical protein